MKGSKKCSSFNLDKKSHPGSSSFSNYDGKEVVVEQFGKVDLQVNYKDPIKCEKEKSKEGNLSKKFNLCPSTQKDFVGFDMSQAYRDLEGFGWSGNNL